ncbi:MAG: hypothetical protein OEW17_05140 [Gemmatimonadota bacterium]|nr:hypothetical protein [Gemmatimonadota bacterium]MDH4348167.1 hypothetical protein [Gemmatimonadota bacterium]MDH5282247.1 hypothetical protein [Gemmatimonadota bacterium]
MRISPTVVTALALLGAPLAAQDAPSAEKATDTLLASQSFTTRGEFIRVVLRGGDTYRVELGDRTQTQVAPGLVELRPLQSGVQRPRVRKSMSGDSYEIEVFVTAEYELSADPPAGRAMIVKLYWDAKRTAKRHAEAAKEAEKAAEKDGE